MIARLFVPLDGSPTALRAMPHAAALARLFGARIVLARVPEATVVPVMSGAIWVTEEVETPAAVAAAESYLAEVRASPDLAGIEVDAVTPPPPAASGLLEALERSEADLIVVTTHGHSGFRRFVFGSVADKLVRSASVPAYVIREPETEPGPPAYRRILVPLDGSELAEEALDPACDLARRAGAMLTLVQVPTVPAYVTGIPETAGWIPKYLQEQSAEAMLYLQGRAAALVDRGVASDVDVEVVTAGSVADGILASAHEHDVDLIVMSTHGRSGLGRWVFGSVADQVLRGAEKPVWLVRSSGAAD